MVETGERREQFYAQYGGLFHGRLVQEVGQIFEKYYDGAHVDVRVALALATVPRHRFAEGYSFSQTYRNNILDLETDLAAEFIVDSLSGKKLSRERIVTVVEKALDEHNATASQPALVAYMTQMVLPDMNTEDSSALDIGCGTGYQTAILSETGFSHVTGVEIKPHLAKKAAELLKDTPGVRIISGDGKSLPTRRKFDGIVVGAQVNSREDLERIKSYLALGGKMIAPVELKTLGLTDEQIASAGLGKGNLDTAALVLITRVGVRKFTQASKGIVGFVDLV